MIRSLTPVRLVASLGVAAVVALGLGACAPATTPSATSSGHPHAHPTPTATQAAVPQIRVPVTCGSLISDQTAATLIGVPIANHVDQSTNPVDLIDIVARQYGSLICLWGGSGRTDGGYDENLTVEVTPDASQGYTSNLTALSAEQPPTVSNTAGDKSVYGCASGAGLNCIGNMVVGSYWVTATLQSLADSTTTTAVASSRMQQALTAIAAGLKNAVPLAAWNPPGAGLPSFCSDSGSTAEVNSALGVTDFTLTGQDDGPADAESWTQQPADYAQCTWGDSGSSSSEKFSYLSVGMLRGGAWVMPSLAGESDSRDYTLGPYVSVTIPGADAAVSSCSTGSEECSVYFTIGSLLVSVQLDDAGPSLVDAALTKLVGDISQS